MPKHKVQIYVLIYILLTIGIIAEEKKKTEDSNEIPQDQMHQPVDPHSAITIVDAPDLSKESRLHKGDKEESDDNVAPEKSLPPLEMITLTGESWVQKFLSQVEGIDNDFTTESDEAVDLELELTEPMEPPKELTAEEKQGKYCNQSILNLHYNICNTYHVTFIQMYCLNLNFSEICLKGDVSN